MKKGLISVCLACCLVFALFLVRAQAEDTVVSGFCGGEGDGSNLTWTLDGDGLLTIDGTGAMPDYDAYVVASASDLNLDGQSPWIKYSDAISAVDVHDGVTSIGASAFDSCSNLMNVTIPDSVTSIGARAFHYCPKLERISLPDSVTSIGAWAFSYCYDLSDIDVSGSGEKIEANAFDRTGLPLISFENKTIPFGATAYVAVYAADGKMLALEKPFLIGTEPALLLPAEVYQNIKTAKLLVVDGSSFVPSGECGTFTKD